MRRLGAILVVLFLLIESAYWGATRGLSGANDLGEAFCVYNAGKNFANFGLLNLKFLQDDATGNLPESHPHYYTHQPMFPVYLSYLWHRLGARSFEAQSLITMGVFFLGLVFMFLFLERKISEPFAVLAVLAGLLDLLGTMTWGTHLFRAYSWPLLWGTLLFRKRPFLLSIFIFLNFYFEWSFALFVVGVLICGEIQRNRRVPWKFGSGIALVAASSILLRVLVVGNAVGWSVFTTDILLTLSNRLTGSPGWSEIQKFYEAHHFSLWGLHAKISFSFLLESISLFYQRVHETLGWGTLEINGLALFLPVIVRFSENAVRVAWLHRSLVISALGLWALSPLYVHHAYVHPFFPLFVFPLTFGKAVLIWQGYELFSNYVRVVVGMGVGALAIGFCFQLSEKTWFPLPDPETLQIAKNGSLFTNYHGWYGSYLTGNWGATSWGRVSEGSGFFHKQYVLERDKKPDVVDKYDFPDYVLCVNSKNVNPCTVDGDFHVSYPVAQSGRGYILYDVRRRKQMRPTQREGKWIVADAHWASSRDLFLIRPEQMSHPTGQDARKNDAEWTLAVEKSRKLEWGTLDSILAMDVGVGPDSPALNVFAVQASQEKPSDLFQSVRIFGSFDKARWEQVTFLVRPAVPHRLQWTTWEFENDEKYPYYRLLLAPAIGQEKIRFTQLRFVHQSSKPINQVASVRRANGRIFR